MFRIDRHLCIPSAGLEYLEVKASDDGWYRHTELCVRETSIC